MPDPTNSQQPKLLDQVRQVLRLHHYSIHTERFYEDWIVRFVRFYSMRSREDIPRTGVAWPTPDGPGPDGPHGPPWYDPGPHQ